MGKLLSFAKLFVKGYTQFRQVGGIAHLSIAQVSHGGILEGRKVVVTGGSDGIGLAMAQKFLSEGASVLITGRSMDKLERAKQTLANDKLLVLQWDVSDFGILEMNFNKAVSLLGGLDLFVNNAGYLHTMAASEQCWDSTIDTNMKAAFFLCQAATDYFMGAQGSVCKKIINISSLNAVQSWPDPYFISKSGLDAITRGFAKKYASHNIVVNGIAPGVCASSINYRDVSANAYYRDSANKRIITPTEIAELACFLASDAANGIVGQTILCDGGTRL